MSENNGNNKNIKINENIENNENIKINVNMENNENKINDSKQNIIDYYNLNDKELEEAKNNCFILIGKTGTGKTSLLNVLYELKDIGIVGRSLKSETKNSNYYPISFVENNNQKKNFCIIDTPGLFDSDKQDNDELHLEQLKGLIYKESLKIKGFLYLSNFQKERFDNSEIKSLIKYNSFFPHKDFWKRMIFIFSHFYGDFTGESAEEMKLRKSKIISQIFEKIMEKTKNISTPILFQELNCKYINIYSPAKNEIQKKNNQINRIKIILDLIKFTEFEPLYSKIKIIKYKNIETNLKKDFLFDVEASLFYDLSGKNFDIHYDKINAHRKKENQKEKEEIYVFSKNCELDKNGELKYVENEIKNSLSSKIINNIYKLIFPFLSLFSNISYQDLDELISKEKQNTIDLINNDLIKSKKINI